MTSEFDLAEAMWLRKMRKQRQVKTISGVPPLMFEAKGTDLEDYRIYGNTEESTDGKSRYVVGLNVDFEKNTFTRLADAETLTAGDDFNNFSAFGGRRRCNVLDDGTITAYYGDSDYVEDGSNGQVMVYQPLPFITRLNLSKSKRRTQELVII